MGLRGVCEVRGLCGGKVGKGGGGNFRRLMSRGGRGELGGSYG